VASISPFAALQTKLQALVDRQASYNWTPPALSKSLQASLDSVAAIGVTMELASPSGNAFQPAAGQPTDALSLGVGVSASAAAQISMGVSLGIGISATASLGAQLVTGLHAAISGVATLERDLAEFNASAQLVAGTNGVMPPGRRVDQGKVNRSLRGLNGSLQDCQSKANAAAAGRPVSPISAELRMKRMGAWHCDLDLDQETIETGKVKFILDDIEFTGTAIPEQSGIEGSRARCKVVGGNGRLSREVNAHSYSGGAGVKIGSVVRDILKDCGEDLSDLSDGPTLDRKLPRWQVTQGTAEDALTKLADHTDCAWRVLRDGTVWFGEETWPEVEPDGTLVNENWSSGALTLAADTPNMVPGTVYQGQKVERVTHRYGETLRTDIETTSASTALGKLRSKTKQEVDYSREWPCKVVTQNIDGTLQLLPDDEVMRGNGRGLDHVPIRYGMPGMKALISAGARCHLAFAAGDPSRPFVGSWEYDPSTVELITVLDGGQDQARVGDLTQQGGVGTVVTFSNLAGLPVGAPPNNALQAGIPYLISFGPIPPTLLLANPLYGFITTGKSKFKS
jgi:hypothetical protein